MDDFIKNSIVMRGDVTCPIAMAATVLSDQWTVIVLRDIAFFNQRTFGAVSYTHLTLPTILLV